jgi:type II secretory pathway pseudopilin PulG
VTRRGFSLLEILVAFAILVLGALTLFGVLAEVREQQVRADVTITGRMLASSILDHARHRWNRLDRRFFRLTDTPQEMVTALAADRWRKPFLALAQPRARIIGSPGDTGAYFDPVTGPPLPGTTEWEFFEPFSYEVRVGFEVVLTAGTAPVVLSATSDGHGATDLAQVEVEVFYSDVSVCRLVTLMGAPDTPLGLKAVAAEVAP